MCGVYSCGVYLSGIYSTCVECVCVECICVEYICVEYICVECICVEYICVFDKISKIVFFSCVVTNNVPGFKHNHSLDEGFLNTFDIP